MVATFAQAIALAEKAITLYVGFSYLYRCVISELNAFDGRLRSRHQGEAVVKIGLMLIEELNHTQYHKAVTKVRLNLIMHYHILPLS